MTFEIKSSQNYLHGIIQDHKKSFFKHNIYTPSIPVGRIIR